MQNELKGDNPADHVTFCVCVYMCICVCVCVCVHVESKSKLSEEISWPGRRRVQTNGTLRVECECGVTDIMGKISLDSSR